MRKDANNEITENNEKYKVVTLSDGTEVKIRYPKGKDLRFAMSGTRGDEAGLTFKLASNLTCMSEAELDELPAKDCSLILGVVASFLA
ncbi:MULTISPECIES: phage tail assembly protein [Campylobacter]|uniref:phage tail assembly protein n=1 Tax=Campylobacter TaxID=194 RepID=UPI0019CFD072|nr:MULTISPECIES: phage tail assembly protein [Campylobacter]MBN7287463.1 phage tail assembly protein [Campylobacter curvus]MDU6828084.1 phage tail assembly protein [Campylobacter sp.]